MSETSMPVEIFCSYAHEDEAWRDKLERQMSVLQRQGLISLWHDRLIVPGTDWTRAIDTHLDAASIVLLLVSADFFASDYCVGIEMQRALARQEEGSALVIPILVHLVKWHDAPFAHLQVLPNDAKPLATWQDEEMALTDVMMGIRRAVETLPLLAASAPRAALPPIWNIPYPRNPFFLGREREIAQIRQQLRAGQTTALSQTQAISGLGGIGKTQLALEYAYRYHQDYQVVLWAWAESTEVLTSSYVALARQLRLPEREAKERGVTVQAVKTWLQTHRSWLLILDNADELTLLTDFLPPSLGGHLLLTTRATATGQLAHRLEIETLLPEQGALLLLRRAVLLEPDVDLLRASQEVRELALQISQELGGLPLALDQAGAYLEETGTDLISYWQIYQQRRDDLLRLRGGFVADHPEPVATTWSLSFQRVEEKNPAAADLMRLCAHLVPDAIAEEILTAGALHLGPVLTPIAADPFLLNQAIEALRAYSLVRRNPGEKILSIHRLVQAVLQGTMKETERRSWAERAMLAINAAFPDPEPHTWPKCERLQQQALTAIQTIERYQIFSEEAAHLLHQMASYLQSHARYSEAEPLYRRALHIREKMLGTEHLQVASLLTGLADLYTEQGSKYELAEPLYQRALHIREQALSSEHSDLAESLDGLGCLYTAQGKYELAEPLYQRALHIREQAGHPLIAQPLYNLAFISYKQGNYDEAEPLYLRAKDLLEQANNPYVAYPLDGLANLYRKQGKYKQAEPLYQRAVQLWQEIGPEHHLVAQSLDGLADLYTEQGTYGEAEPLYLRALHILEQTLRFEHPYVAYPLIGLANLYCHQGKYDEAKPLYLRALHIREQTLGAEHPETSEVLHNLAIFQEAQGDAAAAKSLYARALAVREQALKMHHPSTIETRTRLIALLHTMGQHEEAIQLESTQPEP